MNNCNCAYCKEGMSKSAGECVVQLADDAKSFKESLKDVTWEMVFKKMYSWYRGRK